MKLTRKNYSLIATFVLFGLVIGTLAWEVLERVLSELGVPLDASVGPIGFDLYVISAFIRINPGSLLGLIGGVLLCTVF